MTEHLAPLDPTYLTLPELSTRTGLPLSWFYERSRRDALPGQRRARKYVRVRLDEFLSAFEAGLLR